MSETSPGTPHKEPEAAETIQKLKEDLAALQGTTPGDQRALVWGLISFGFLLGLTTGLSKEWDLHHTHHQPVFVRRGCAADLRRFPLSQDS